MRHGDTARVARLLRAYALIQGADGKVPLTRLEVLERRIRAVLPQLSKAETEAYYAGVRRVRAAQG